MPKSKTKHHNLYENEHTSDVVLIFGEDDNRERVPGHTWVLANGSDYFRALFQGPFSNPSNKIHHFPDNPNGFNNLIKWIYQNRCDLQSLNSSLETLQVAIKYLCPELVEYCIGNMLSQINTDNVLMVLGWIHAYCYPNNKPSAPSLQLLEENDPTTAGSRKNLTDISSTSQIDPTSSCHQLLGECLNLIDKETEKILSTESFFLSDNEVLYIVLKRNSLNVKSEMQIFKALLRWSTAMCKRKQIKLTQENKREALGSLLYLPRYLAMSQSEVKNESVKEELGLLLTPEELGFVVSTVNGSHEMVIPYSMLDFREAIAAKRTVTPEECLPVKSKKPKKVKKKLGQKDLVLDLVSVLAMIFD